MTIQRLTTEQLFVTRADILRDLSTQVSSFLDILDRADVNLNYYEWRESVIRIREILARNKEISDMLNSDEHGNPLP